MDAVVKYRNVTQNMSVAIIFLVFSFIVAQKLTLLLMLDNFMIFSLSRVLNHLN